MLSLPARRTKIRKSGTEHHDPCHFRSVRTRPETVEVIRQRPVWVEPMTIGRIECWLNERIRDHTGIEDTNGGCRLWRGSDSQQKAIHPLGLFLRLQGDEISRVLLRPAYFADYVEQFGGCHKLIDRAVRESDQAVGKPDRVFAEYQPVGLSECGEQTPRALVARGTDPDFPPNGLRGRWEVVLVVSPERAERGQPQLGDTVDKILVLRLRWRFY